MFGIGSTELVIILIVALVLIGPSKLPDLMKSVGKGIAEFRRMSTDVKSTLAREIEKADEAKRIEETKKELFGDDDKTAEAAPASPERKDKTDAAVAEGASSGNVTADAALQMEAADAAPAEVAAAWSDLLRDRAQALALGRHGRQWVERRHAPAVVLEQFARFYRRVVPEK